MVNKVNKITIQLKSFRKKSFKMEVYYVRFLCGKKRIYSAIHKKYAK